MAALLFFAVSGGRSAEADATASKGSPTAQPSAAPDNYFTYDRALQGLRGKFGAYSFSGTTQGAKGEHGRTAFASCAILAPADAPLAGGTDSALEAAEVEVVGEDGQPQEETSSASAGRDVAVLTASYRLGPAGKKSAGWSCKQAWLYTSRRMVGLLSVTSLEQQEAKGTSATFRFRAPKPQDSPSSKDTFQFGGLITRICATNFSAQTPGEGQLRLADSKDAPVTYAAGESRYCLVEVRPKSSAPAKSVALLDLKGGLVGFEVVENEKHYTLIFNPTDDFLLYQLKTPGAFVSQGSGEQYSPASGKGGRERWTQRPRKFTVQGGATNFMIDGGTHLLITDE